MVRKSIGHKWMSYIWTLLSLLLAWASCWTKSRVTWDLERVVKLAWRHCIVWCIRSESVCSTIVSMCVSLWWALLKLLNRYPIISSSHCNSLEDLGTVSISDQTYRKISQSLEAARFVFRIVRSLWNLAGTSAALLPRCMSNLKAIRTFWLPISRLRDFTRSHDKMQYIH